MALALLPRRRSPVLLGSTERFVRKKSKHTHKKITLPPGLPPPYCVIAQVVPLAYQRGQPPTHTVMAFFFFNSSLILAVKFTLYT